MESASPPNKPLIHDVLYGGSRLCAFGAVAWALLGRPYELSACLVAACFAELGRRRVHTGNATEIASATVAASVMVVVVTMSTDGGVHGGMPVLLCALMLLGLATLGRAAAITTVVTGLSSMSALTAAESAGWFVPRVPDSVETLATSAIGIAVAGIVVARAMERIQQARTEAEALEARAKEALRAQLEEVERRTQIEERLQDALVQARQANKAKSRFLASMSHELRTPLNAIIGYAEILEEEASPGSSDAADLRRIQGAGKHLLGLINDVLDLSKIEAGRMALQPTEVDVDRLLREVAETIIPSIEGRGNRLELDAPTIGHAFLDGMRLRQVLLNLLSNAAKFTENGTVSLQARRLGEGTPDEQLRFQVVDTGIGITTEQQARLFQAFSQADNSISRKYGGTGLGLALCRRFAEMMEGTVELDSAIGEGTTVTFTLPTLTEATQLERLKGRRLEELPVARAERPVVLCIDDEASALTLLDRMLREEGVHPVPCRDPMLAIEMALEVRPNVITLDLHMPNLDGGELLRMLKEHEELAEVPVVVVSVDGAASSTLQLGAAAWMRKPIDRQRLLSLIASVGSDAEAPVLVVDDDGPTRDVLVRMLQAGGFKSVEASDGRQALSLLESVTPRLVLLDLMMPEMDGFQVAEALRNDDRWSDLPIVVLTSATLDEEDHERLSQVASVLSKDERTLRNLVAEVKRVA